MALVETWRSDSDMPDLIIPGYQLFFQNRQITNRNARRNSGGIAVYAKNNLHLEMCDQSTADILWLKWPKQTNNTDFDIFVCIAYIPPAISPRHAFVEDDLFDRLAQQVTSFSEKGEIIVLGDLNARIGQYDKCVHIPTDRHEPYVPVDDTDLHFLEQVPSRRTSDHIIDEFGKKLIQILNAGKLLVINGRVGKDLLAAALTCIKKNKDGAVQGGSTVDYCITSLNVFSCVANFEVLEDVGVGLSKHRPFEITCELNCPNLALEQHQIQQLFQIYEGR